MYLGTIQVHFLSSSKKNVHEKMCLKIQSCSKFAYVGHVLSFSIRYWLIAFGWVIQPDYKTTDTTPTRHSLNNVLMLDERLRRWHNIEPTLGACTVVRLSRAPHSDIFS